jgi:hypothetical protein
VPARKCCRESCENDARPHPKRSCSDECAAEAMREKSRRHYHRNAKPAESKPDIDCAICGASFSPRTKLSKYCSEMCRGKSQIAARTAVKGPRCCYKCGAGVEVAPGAPGRTVCESCRAEPLRERRQEIERNRTLRRYGITQDDFDRMLTEQGGRCAICATDSPGGRSAWHIDHDHATGAVRGLLCHLCNVGIGNLRDDTDIMRSAIAYLDRHRAAACGIPVHVHTGISIGHQKPHVVTLSDFTASQK